MWSSISASHVISIGRGLWTVVNWNYRSTGFAPLYRYHEYVGTCLPNAFVDALTSGRGFTGLEATNLTKP